MLLLVLERNEYRNVVVVGVLLLFCFSRSQSLAEGAQLVEAVLDEAQPLAAPAGADQRHQPAAEDVGVGVDVDVEAARRLGQAPAQRSGRRRLARRRHEGGHRLVQRRQQPFQHLQR